MTFDIAELRRKSEEGSCVSQCALGLCYLYGHDVAVDYDQAFRFLSAAANQGASRAVLNLGYMHAQGLGVPRNVEEAIRLFEAVAEPSHSSDAFAARIELARIFAHGLGVAVDAKAAVHWYSEALALAEGEESDEAHEARSYIAKAGPESRVPGTS